MYKMYKLKKSGLDGFFAAIAKKQSLYLPVEQQNGNACYTEWQKGCVYSEKTNTVRSAKDFFFPQVQSLADFKRNGKTVEVFDARRESEDFTVFGVRACDARSFKVLDRVFLSEPVDSCYQTRREHCTVISVACNRPDNTCFCGSFGIDAANPDGDIAAWIAGTAVYFLPQTERGKKLIDSLGSILTEYDGDEVEKAKAEIKKTLTRLPLSGLKYRDLTAKQLEVFNSPIWAEFSQTCLGCGACTFVCPTCQCYDIRDFDTGSEIKRFRCWDSCMYSDFTLMAAANPRLTQLERFRQRFMHKLVYYPANNNGEPGCVGCGRCLKSCPISMNIAKVMKALGEAEND